MIIVEEVLTEMFEGLPEISGFKPTYKWGDEIHLLKQLTIYSKENKSIYPLIYQTSNSSEQNKIERLCITNLELVLACQNIDTSLTNEQRWAMSYRNVLFPLVENLEKCFTRSGIITWDKKYSIKEYPNYGNGKENFTADKWDALVFKAKITINKGCVKNINYNI